MGDFHKNQTFITSLNYLITARAAGVIILHYSGTVAGCWPVGISGNKQRTQRQSGQDRQKEEDSSFSEHEGLQRRNKVGSQITKKSKFLSKTW